MFLFVRCLHMLVSLVSCYLVRVTQWRKFMHLCSGLDQIGRLKGGKKTDFTAVVVRL